MEASTFTMSSTTAAACNVLARVFAKSIAKALIATNTASNASSGILSIQVCSSPAAWTAAWKSGTPMSWRPLIASSLKGKSTNTTCRPLRHSITSLPVWKSQLIIKLFEKKSLSNSLIYFQLQVQPIRFASAISTAAPKHTNWEATALPSSLSSGLHLKNTNWPPVPWITGCSCGIYGLLKVSSSLWISTTAEITLEWNRRQPTTDTFMDYLSLRMVSFWSRLERIAECICGTPALVCKLPT